MSTFDEYTRVVSAIYDAGLDFANWPIALEQLADALEASSAVLRSARVNTPGKWVSVRIDPAFDPLYVNYYQEAGALWRSGGKPTETCECDRQVIPRDQLFRTEYYNEFLLPQDTHTTLRTYVLAGQHWQAVLSINRSPRQGEWEHQHLDLLRRFAPHLHRAAQINLRLGTARLEEESSAEALNKLACGVFIVTGDGRVLFANSAAETIIAMADGISITSTGLQAAEPRQSSALRRLIAAATDDSGPAAAGGTLSLSRPSGRRPLALLVAPLHVRIGWFADRQPRALVFVIDLERAPIVPERIFNDSIT